MKDVITSYWFNYKMYTIEFGDRSKEAQKHILKSKFAIATIHDISPKYTDKVFQLADEL